MIRSCDIGYFYTDYKYNHALKSVIGIYFFSAVKIKKYHSDYRLKVDIQCLLD